MVIPKYLFLYTEALVLESKKNPLKNVSEKRIIRNKPSKDIRNHFMN